MSVWSKWTRQPQTVWLRRALFQIHLWIGLALGLYLVMLSLTGSALVYRNELDAYFRTVRPVYDAKARRLTSDELRSAALRAYPGHTVTRVGDQKVFYCDTRKAARDFGWTPTVDVDDGLHRLAAWIRDAEPALHAVIADVHRGREDR